MHSGVNVQHYYFKKASYNLIDQFSVVNPKKYKKEIH